MFSEKYEGLRTNQQINVPSTTLTCELSSSTREIRHGAGRPNPHETRVSRVNRNAAGRVGSGQEVFKHSRVRADRAKTSQNFRRLSRVM